MKMLEKTAKTIEEAVELALKELNATIENVEVEVVQQPHKGFLGFGSKPAVVRVNLKYDPILKAKQFLQNIFQPMDLEVDIDAKHSDDGLHIELLGSEMGVVIGKRGETLDALQYLTSLVVNKEKEQEFVKVTIDTENYRTKREETLVQLANKLANQVKKTKKTIVLEPMNAYERKIIHATLQNHRAVNTHSEGNEPYRKVVITAK